mmetsp:Transcript_18184/g.31118  ORF Transcript_18184/g.31118 Transcript_18184/m.31118 type:complete len:113 (+) Transcript_18184:1528-1866(+)
MGEGLAHNHTGRMFYGENRDKNEFKASMNQQIMQKMRGGNNSFELGSHQFNASFTEKKAKKPSRILHTINYSIGMDDSQLYNTQVNKTAADSSLQDQNTTFYQSQVQSQIVD